MGLSQKQLLLHDFVAVERMGIISWRKDNAFSFFVEVCRNF
jgi:hypothetical protein